MKPLSSGAATGEDRKLNILYDIALTVGSSLDLRSILDGVLDKVIRFMSVDSGVIYVINEENLELIPVSFRNLSEEVVRDLTENRVKLGECMCGTIAQCDREVIIREKASMDPRFTREVLSREGMEFYAGLPLKSKGKVVGVLCAITHEPYVPGEGVLEVLQAATVPIGLAIDNALRYETLERKAGERPGQAGFEGIVAVSRKMSEVLEIVRKVKDVGTSILISGESGTGKELVSRALHRNSARKDRPFMAINCGAIPEELLESELFGYTKGAFTGADAEKKGLLEAARGGTVFLDEVGTMSPALQVKLLRFLQDRSFYKVGGTKPLTVDLSVIAATNRDLEGAVRSGEFREDLYYRLNVIRITIPPLRERAEDVPLLARFFINRYNKALGKGIKRVSPEAMERLINHHWPGNVRQLENFIQRAVVLASSSEISPGDLPPELASSDGRAGKDLSLERMEKEHVLKVLSLFEGSRARTAGALGIDKATLWRKMKKYGLMD
jgi:transcriptional regulator with GAF, ATPase, and Fis domain